MTRYFVRSLLLSLAMMSFSLSVKAEEDAASPAPAAEEKSDASAAAEDAKRPSTPCDGDAETLCKGETNMDACLRANRDKIKSEECVKARNRFNNQLQHAGTALPKDCRDDAMVYCQKAKASREEISKCLEENAKKLSDSCKSAVDKKAE